MDTIERIKAFFFIAVLSSLLIGCDEDERIREQGEYVEISEYQERFVYEDWDLDASGDVNENELSLGVFESLDTNNDALLMKDEWEQVEFYFTGNDYGAFNEWDLNNDGRLEENEFEAAIDNTALFDQWDSNNDGRVEDRELSTGVFDTFDTDDDGLLDDEEFSTWEDYQAY